MLDAIVSWLPIVIPVTVSIITAGLGGWLTRLGPWYRNLAKPSWQPPDWAFGPVWTVIFVFGTTAAVIAWGGALDTSLKLRVILLFGVNLGLNVAWSALFFRLERPDWALIEVVVLWLSIVALIVGLWPISATASLLLLPYLVWVSIASYLNLTIVRLNPQHVRSPVARLADSDVG
jgi:tryptophan-rich sensory protein